MGQTVWSVPSYGLLVLGAVSWATKFYFIPDFNIVGIFIFAYLALTFARIRYWRLRSYYLARKNNAQLIPAVTTWVPLNIGLIFTGIKYMKIEEPGQIISPYFEQYNSKTFNLRILGREQMNTCDPKVMKHILTGQSFQNFGKGPFFKNAFNNFLGVGIFNSDPDEIWKFHRNLTKPFFSKERITDFKLDHIDKMVKHIKNASKGNSSVDFQDYARRLTFDSSNDFLFAYHPNALDDVGGNGPASEFVRAFDEVSFATMKLAIMGEVKTIFELFNPSTQKDPMKIITPLVEKIVAEALQRSEHAKNDHAKEHECVLDYLVTQTTDAKLIRDELLNLLLAGRDTTASLLSSLFYEFAKHPEVYKRAREEAISLFDTDGEPDYRVMRDSRFMRALLNETLRLYPTVPINTRYCFQDDVVTAQDGQRLFVPADTVFNYDLYTMQRSTENWGPDAEIWDPDRWLDSRIEYMTSNPFIFQPFSAGPRLCLGQQHAYNQATLTLIRMLQAFERIETVPEVQAKYYPISQITLHWEGGMNLRFTPASSA